LNKNIVFIGFMGTGKTSVGKFIAEKLYLNFIDIDDEIKKYCLMNISDIFMNYGEGYFRKIEGEIVKEVYKVNNYVISTGGGIVLNANNMSFLRENSTIFWLKASVNTILNNLKQDESKIKDRPLLNTENMLERIIQLMQEREMYYNKYYDCKICIDGMSLMEVVYKCINQLYFIQKAVSNS
jgi:shikimate kinase